jgi:hypothetical protein
VQGRERNQRDQCSVGKGRKIKSSRIAKRRPHDKSAIYVSPPQSKSLFFSTSQQSARKDPLDEITTYKNTTGDWNEFLQGEVKKGGGGR